MPKINRLQSNLKSTFYSIKIDHQKPCLIENLYLYKSYNVFIFIKKYRNVNFTNAFK
jgi:hypothetical protein